MDEYIVDNRGILISKNNDLYCVDQSLVDFAREYMKTLPSYKKVDVKEDEEYRLGKKRL